MECLATEMCGGHAQMPTTTSTIATHKATTHHSYHTPTYNESSVATLPETPRIWRTKGTSGSPRSFKVIVGVGFRVCEAYVGLILRSYGIDENEIE